MNKILHLEDLVEKVKELQRKKSVVVQSHGVFDFIHPGIIEHLKSAKNKGDVLVVTVIKDNDVRKGPGRPVFQEKMRAENVASLEFVDYVCLVDDGVPFECVKRIEPNLFAKGQAFKKRFEKINKKIYKEEKELYFGKSEICETKGFSFSSSEIINNFLYIYSEETREYLEVFSKKYNFDYIAEKLNELRNNKVFLIGDGIIDEYHYVKSLGRSSKANLLVNKYLTHEVFAGGAFAIANHLAGICGEVKLVSLLGNEDKRDAFILNNIKPNVSHKFFYRDDGPTVIKKRYIDQYLNQKLFEVNYLNDIFVNDGLEEEICEYLEREIEKYDLVLISDFGHGFITKKMFDVIRRKAKIFGVNSQTNGANIGYNLITKYKNANYVCVDEVEIRLAAQEKYANVDEIIRKISDDLKMDYLLVTLGKKGSIGINRKRETTRTPIFSSKVIDTVGAGDAFFAYTAPCFAHGFSLDVVSFIGNAVGALAVQIVGNKKPVEKHELLNFIHAILKR